MNKEEMLKMAREAGFWIDERSEDIIERFTNAILERAAVECKSVKAVFDKDHKEDEYCNFTNGARKGSTECINEIRALKTNNV